MARIIDWKVLATLVPYSRQHILRLEKVGTFPRRVRLGNGPRSRTGWVYDEVQDWIALRVNDRTAPHGATIVLLPPPPRRLTYEDPAE